MKLTYNCTLLLALLTTSIAVGAEQQVSADFVKNELELARSQYLYGSSETGLYALTALARLLESDKSEALLSEVGVNNLSFTYARIGLLLEKSGKTVEAATYFDKALASYQGETTVLSDLKTMVQQLDAQQGIR